MQFSNRHSKSNPKRIEIPEPSTFGRLKTGDTLQILTTHLGRIKLSQAEVTKVEIVDGLFGDVRITFSQGGADTAITTAPSRHTMRATHTLVCTDLAAVTIALQHLREDIGAIAAEIYL